MKDFAKYKYNNQIMNSWERFFFALFLLGGAIVILALGGRQ